MFRFKTILIIFILLIINNKLSKKVLDVKNPNEIDALVNKYNKLDKFYRPYDLVKLNLKCSNKDKYLRKEAAKYFEEMCSNASKSGYKIIAVSTYRSYFYQKELFNKYIKEMGLKKTLSASAKPGHSEHQLGLSVDVEGSNLDYNKFENSKEFKWMINNSYKYGFILRYPKGKEYITGFKYEPWHYRYVGIKIAKEIHDKNITLEEYKKRIK